MMKRTIPFLLVLALASLINASCKSQNNEDIIEIRYGSQFGMCTGYCFHEIILTESSETVISKSWQNSSMYPNKREEKEMTDILWKKLISSVKLDDFYSLESTIGCPDCADGGENWIRITTRSKSYQVNYEYGQTPSSLRELVASF